MQWTAVEGLWVRLGSYALAAFQTCEEGVAPCIGSGVGRGGTLLPSLRVIFH